VTLFLPGLTGMHLPEPAPPTGPLRILIVDDEEPLLRPINRLLSAEGFDTMTARNGFEALKCLRVAPEPLDVALIDISMPGLDGVETARQLRLLQPGLPVLLTSGYASMIQSQGIPFDDITRFAKKPWNNIELLETLRDLSGREPEKSALED
jgi:CheY-like chemotaxis protein